MYFCNAKPIQPMTMKNRILALAIVALTAISLTSCVKKDSVLVSSQDLWFNLEESTQTIVVTANCKWTVTKNDDADWYTITPMSGSAEDSIVTVTVNAYPDGDFRGSSFVVTSPGGHIRRTVFVSQNKLDFDGIVNKIFAVTEHELWNTDYFGQIIEDSYRHYEFDPYDTTQGYLMYFLEDGIGYQRDRFLDHAIYYSFNYEYTPYNNNLFIEFETVNGAPESYNAQVLCASDSLYRIMHEYKPNFWERADHRKIGTITPEEKAFLKQKTVKRKQEREGIYQLN